MNVDVHGPQGILADLDDTSPATYWYYFHDHLGSTRRVRAQNKNSLGVYEYTPYGEIYSESGASIGFKWTGRLWDPLANLYYGCHYCASLARYITRPYLDDGNNPVTNGTGENTFGRNGNSAGTPSPPAIPNGNPSGSKGAWGVITNIAGTVASWFGKGAATQSFGAVTGAVTAYSNITDGIKAGAPDQIRNKGNIDDVLDMIEDIHAGKVGEPCP